MKVVPFIRTDYDAGADTPAGAVGIGTPISAGDLSGTHGVPLVTGVGGVSVSGTPAAGEVLTATSGTAADWAAPAFVNPMTTAADLIVGDTGGAPIRLAKGADSQVLTVDPTTHLLVWATPGSGSSPLTTKGDVWGYSTTDARIPIGTDTYVLTADSTQTLGLKWAAGGGGGSIEVAAYADATGGYTALGTGSATTWLTLTHTFPAGTFLFLCHVQTERTSGTHAQLLIDLDGSKRWPSNTSFDVNSFALSLDGSVKYEVDIQVVATLSAGSHTIAMIDNSGAPFHVYDRSIVAFTLA